MLQVDDHWQQDTMNNAISIGEVRKLARSEGSFLLEDVSDAEIDDAIRLDIERPLATPLLLAASAVCWCEFAVLRDRLRDMLADGSILDCEPATDKQMRVYRRVKRAKPPPMQVFADAVDAAAKQEFLLRRLVTAAADIVDDAGADFDAAQCALAVHDAVYRSISDVAGRIDTRVIHAIPDDEWDALIEARRACHAHYREMENGPPIRVVVEAP